MPLSKKSGFNAILVSFWRPNREEDKRKRKRRWRSQDQSQKGMDTWILVWKLNLCKDSMRLSMNFHALMLKCLSPNLGF